MRKLKKSKSDNKASERIVTYVSQEMIEWVRAEANRLAMNESAFIRYTLQQTMNGVTVP